MKLLIVSTNADEAGAPRHAELLARTFLGKYELAAVFGETGPVEKRLAVLGVACHVVPSMRNAISPWTDLLVAMHFAKIVRAERPDLIHCHSAKASFIGRLVGFVLNIKVVYTVHGWGWRGYPGYKGWLIKTLERVLSLLPNVEYIFVSNAVLRDGLEHVSPDLGSKGRVIYNSVDVPADAQRPQLAKPVVFLMAARVCEAKDHRTLLQAFEKVTIKSKLILCGAGTESHSFKAMAKQLAPRKFADIEFIGQTSDVFDHFSRAHVGVLISHFEALPLTLIESMALGMPVIASAVGGVPELVEEGANGFLVGAEPSAIADAMNRMDSQELRHALGQESQRRYRERFSMPAMVCQVEALYAEALTGRAPA